MKKICFLLALAMLLGALVACGGSEKEQSGTGDEQVQVNPNAGISLDTVSATLPVGQTLEIVATLIPRLSTDDTALTFESSLPEVASVAANGNKGTVTALKEGSVTITVTSADGEFAASCDIRIVPAALIPDDPDKPVDPDDPDKPVDPDDPDKPVDPDDPDKPVDPDDPDKPVDPDKPEPNPNAGITLDKTQISLKQGETATLKATYIPLYDTDSKTVTFRSSSDKVATVDQNGKITAVSAGSAVITVTAGSFSASCTVTVTAKAPDPVELKVVDYPASKVRHIFSHCLIAYPEMGCGDPAKGNGSLDVDCLTVSEFQILLQSLYDNGFCLIDINDMYENYTENGVVKSRLKKNVQVYEGKKPLVISVDDVVYDSRKLDWGMIDRLEIQNDTIVGVKDFDGKLVYSDKEIFPQLEKFIESHPDFSFQGAKCTLALTGFEGILGYRTDDQFAEQGIDYKAEREKAKVVVNWLKENGYNFASHSYSHSNYTNCSQSRVDRDIERWNSQVKPLIGETKVFVYPYGAFTYYGTETHNKLLAEGFTIFCGTAQTNCLWDGKHPKKKDSSGSSIATKTGSIYLERYTITGQTLRDWRDYPSMYEYCDPYATYDHENRFIPMPAKTEE